MADYGGVISLSHARDPSHTSDDDDSSEHSPRSVPVLSGSACGSGGSSKSKIGGSAAAEMMISKKPRGRPPGSKNKPKPPIVITKDSESAMKPVVFEISAGSDVVEALLQYARRRHVGLTVLSGSGSVSNVTLRHPGPHAPSLTLHGPFNLLSLAGSFMESSSSCPPNAASFGICLAGAQGQVFGGIVGGKVVAASGVVVVAATFVNPTFQRLPGGGHDMEVTAAAGASGGEYEAEERKPNCDNESCGTVNYVSSTPTPAINCQITSPDHVMPWGPPSRPSY